MELKKNKNLIIGNFIRNCKLGIKNSESGFSFVEVMIAVFIFSLMMIAVMMTFSSLFGGYKNAKSIQKDMESAQFGINLMAKELRTSSILLPNSADIKFYNHSNMECVRYIISPANHNLQRYSRTYNGTDGKGKENCESWTLNAGAVEVVKNVSGRFHAVASDPDSNTAGLVTIFLEIDSGGEDARIQSTVSLRDYEEMGIN